MLHVRTLENLQQFREALNVMLSDVVEATHERYGDVCTCGTRLPYPPQFPAPKRYARCCPSRPQTHPLMVKVLSNLAVLFGGCGDYARASTFGRLAAVRSQRLFRSGPTTVSTHATAGSYTFLASFGISALRS